MKTYVAQLLNFIIFVIVLYYLLYKPVGRIMRERKEKQEADRIEAEKLRAEAEEIRAKAEKARTNLEAQRDGILTKAREQAEAERKEILKSAEEQGRAKSERFRRAMKQERGELLDKLRTELRETILRVAHVMIGDDHAPLMRRALKQVEDLLAEASDKDIAAVREALEKEGQAVSVTTAVPLSEENKNSLRDAFAKRTGMNADDIRLETTEDVSLAAGFEIVAGPLSLSANWRDAIDDALKAQEDAS